MKSILFFVLAICAASCSIGSLNAQVPAPVPPCAITANYAKNIAVGVVSTDVSTDTLDVIVSAPSCWVQVQVGESGDKVISEPANVFFLDSETLTAVCMFDSSRCVNINVRTGNVEVRWGDIRLTGYNQLSGAAIGSK